MDEKQLAYLIENDKQNGMKVDLESIILSRINEKEANKNLPTNPALMKITIAILILISSMMGIIAVNPESETIKDQNLFVNEMHFETVENSILTE